MDAVKLRNRLIIRLLARAITWAFRVLFASVRTRVIPLSPGFSPHCAPDEEHRSLFCVWHDAILCAIFCGRPVNHVAALVSQNYDGSIVAEILNAVGMSAVRGSSSRGGAAAIRRMLDETQRKHVVIATDGPRGPRRVVKDGIVYLASQSGRPIVPVAITGSWVWRPKGRWTDMLIPLPFCRRLIVIGGLPIHVPPGLAPHELEPYRLQVQAAMDELQLRCESAATGQENIDNQAMQTETGTLSSLNKTPEARKAA